MNHQHARRLLADLGTGSLDSATEAALAAHTEHCAACQDWLSVRDLLSESLTDTSDTAPAGGDRHPDSELLALCVVRPEEVREPDREDLRRHLASCWRCRNELTLTRAAVMEAKPKTEAPLQAPAPSPWMIPRTRRMLAATVAILLLSAGLLAGGLLFGRLGWLPGDAPQHAGASPRAPMSDEPAQTISGRDLDGTHVIDSEHKLVVSALTIKSGANITFRAGKSVAFGNGFRVAPGARIAVRSDSADGPPVEKTNSLAGSDRTPAQSSGRLNQRSNRQKQRPSSDSSNRPSNN